MTANRPCLHCKGAHGENDCPLYQKALSLYRVQNALGSSSFAGSSPAPFIGRFGYPHVNVGLLAPPELGEHVAGYDHPRGWGARNAQIPEVVGFRSSMVNSRTKLDVKNRSNVLDLAQEIALASKPVDLDIELLKRPTINMQLDGTMAPMGPSAELKSVALTSNPSIHTRVERVFGDTDLKAAEGLTSLYEHGIDENHLSKMLSTATMGIGKNRRLVPTRWAITATDDTIGKNIIQDVKECSLRHDYAYYFDGYMGNYYLVLVFPEIWSYELFETYLPSQKPDGEANYSTDHEMFAGRKEYAHNTAGGYYTARLAVSERLRKLKRQASALVLRFVTSEYTVPLGVWVTREACRKSMASEPRSFGSKEELLRGVRAFVRQRFSFDADRLLRVSTLLREQRQPTLRDFSNT